MLNAPTSAPPGAAPAHPPVLQHVVQPCLLLLVQLIGPPEPLPTESTIAPSDDHIVEAAQEASHLGDQEAYAVLERVGALVSIDDTGSAERCAARAAAVREVLKTPGGAAVARAALRWQTRVRAPNAQPMLELLDSKQLLESLLLNPCSKVRLDWLSQHWVVRYMLFGRKSTLF